MTDDKQVPGPGSLRVFLLSSGPESGAAQGTGGIEGEAREGTAGSRGQRAGAGRGERQQVPSAQLRGSGGRFAESRLGPPADK